MGNNLIFLGEDDPRKNNNQNPPRRHRRRGSGKNKKQLVEEIKKKVNEDIEKKKFHNKKIKDVWHWLVIMSLPTMMIFWLSANYALHFVADIVQRWLEIMRNMIK